MRAKREVNSKQKERDTEWEKENVDICFDVSMRNTGLMVRYVCVLRSNVSMEITFSYFDGFLVS